MWLNVKIVIPTWPTWSWSKSLSWLSWTTNSNCRRWHHFGLGGFNTSSAGDGWLGLRCNPSGWSPNRVLLWILLLIMNLLDLRNTAFGTIGSRWINAYNSSFTYCQCNTDKLHCRHKLDPQLELPLEVDVHVYIQLEQNFLLLMSFSINASTYCISGH